MMEAFLPSFKDLAMSLLEQDIESVLEERVDISGGEEGL